MAVMFKYRIHEVAKDFNVTSKVISQILTDYIAPPKNHLAARLTVCGLLGGHSGCEIGKGRGNANIILGNLLDNALNACNEADSDKKRFIKLNVCTSLEKGQFIIRTINTNPVRYSNKKMEDLSHGYGLVNIKEHLDKVFGTIDLKENEKEFEVCVIIPLMQIENKASG